MYVYVPNTPLGGLHIILNNNNNYFLVVIIQSESIPMICALGIRSRSQFCLRLSVITT